LYLAGVLRRDVLDPLINRPAAELDELGAEVFGRFALVLVDLFLVLLGRGYGRRPARFFPSRLLLFLLARTQRGHLRRVKGRRGLRFRAVRVRSLPRLRVNSIFLDWRKLGRGLALAVGQTGLSPWARRRRLGTRVLGKEFLYPRMAGGCGPWRRRTGRLP